MVWVDFAGVASSTSAAMTYAAMAAAFHGFAHWAAPAAVDGLWQGAVVALGLAVCLGLMPRVSASHRFAAWAAGFAVAAGLPALPWLARLLGGLAERILARVTGVTGAAAQAASTAGAAHAWRQIDARWSLAIGGLWLAISAYRATGLALHTVRLRRLWKSARPVENGFASLAAHSQLRGVKVCATSELDRPGVIGFFAPRILIPEWLLERLTRDELEQVILHETEHLRRWDDWTNLGQKVCLMLFPLNPALAWMERRLAKEREMACDEGVVRVTRAPRAYAACLASLAERRLENNRLGSHLARAEALSLGAFERRPELVYRVHSILFGGKMLSPVASRALVGMVGCGLVVGSVELARCPQVVAFVPEQRATATTGMTAAVSELPRQVEPVRAVRADYAVARPDEGYRAVSAEAMMPAAGTAVAPRPAMEMRPETSRTALPEPLRAVKSTAKAPATTAARASLVKAAVSAQAAAQPQEWLVVTTWQVQTTFRARNVADYETDGDAKATAAGARQDVGNKSGAGNSAEDAGSSMSASSGDAQGRPANENEFAVTRMFLSVYRATGNTGKTAGTAGSGAGGRLTATSTQWTAAQNQSAKQATKRQFGQRQFGAVPFGDGWLVIEL